MKEYKIVFRVASSYGTSFHADTLFGHICWAIKYLKDEVSLVRFLKAYDAQPPLLVSDAFPCERNGDKSTFYLPKPLLPLNQSERNEFEKPQKENNGSKEKQFNMIETATKLKKLKKTLIIEQNSFIAIRDKLNQLLLLKAIIDKEPDWKIETMEVTHNVINRVSNHSMNLYVQSDIFPAVDYYFLAKIDGDIMTENLLKECMDYIGAFGYGRDASSGKGALKDISISSSDIPPLEDADWFLNLSSAYVPKPSQLKNGYYQTHVKRGKLGGGYVLEAKTAWKKPILMILAGAVLEGNPNAVYGRLIHNVHSEKEEVVHYGFAYPLGVKLNANNS